MYIQTFVITSTREFYFRDLTQLVLFAKLKTSVDNIFQYECK